MARRTGGKSPANIAQYLAGIDFPCEKEDLLEHVKRNGAENEVLDILRNMPEGEYSTIADVMEGCGEARDAEREDEDRRDSRGSSRTSQAKTGSRSDSRAYNEAEDMEEEDDYDEIDELEDSRGSRDGSRRS